MKIICNGPSTGDIAIWTDDGINITQDLDPNKISFTVCPDDGAMQVILECPVKGFVIDSGLGQGEPEILEKDEE